MTNTQLLLSIGIPSFMVLFALLLSNARADRLEKSVEKRIYLVDIKLVKLDDKIEKLDNKIEGLRNSTRRDALEIMRNMTVLHERVAVVEARQK